MEFLPTVQTILNDLIFFVAGGVVFREAPSLFKRLTSYARNREDDDDDRSQRRVR